jgi:uncharacterized iron-regulated protein
LDTLFSFLARKTDFYTGGPKGQALSMIMEKFKKYEQVAMDRFEREKAERDEADRVRKEKLKKKREEEEGAKIVEVNDDEATKILAAENAKKDEKMEISNQNGEKLADKDAEPEKKVTLKLN